MFDSAILEIQLNYKIVFNLSFKQTYGLHFTLTNISDIILNKLKDQWPHYIVGQSLIIIDVIFPKYFSRHNL